MAKRTFFTGGQTYAAAAYTANLTNAQYCAIKGGSATQLIDILEVSVNGMATASTVAAMQLVRASTLEAGAVTALASPNSDGPNHPATCCTCGASCYVRRRCYQRTASFRRHDGPEVELRDQSLRRYRALECEPHATDVTSREHGGALRRADPVQLEHERRQFRPLQHAYDL
jgi:hypothetical protein